MTQPTHVIIEPERQERYRKEEQEALEKQGDLKQALRLFQYLKPRKKKVIAAVFLSLGIALLVPAPMIIIKQVIDVYIEGKDIPGLWLMAGLLLCVQLLIFFLERASAILIARIGQYTMRDLRLEIFRHLMGQPLKFFDRNPVGRLITRITSDVNVLNELFAQGVVGIFQQIFSLVVILGVLFYFNWQLTLWLLPVIPLIALASWNFRNNVFFSYRLGRVRLSRMNTFMQENITGMRTVQAHTREGTQYGIFDRLNDSNRDAHFQTVFQYALFFPLIEIVSTLGLAIILWRGGLMYIDSSSTLSTAVTVGELALFIQALERFFMPIKDLSEKYNIVQAAIASAERLFALLDTKAEFADPDEPEALESFNHNIKFEDVWFAYKENEWVLKGVNLEIKRGETIAIVGPTGSGKSTIISLLCRFYDIQKGSIKIDGKDIRDISQSDLRKKIAIVLQDVFLFYGTVTDNIRLGDKQISKEKVEEVAKATGFHKFAELLPDGYDSGVKERGATLSTGQKQLLSFARALAFDPEILILDEATANIDTESEQQIQRAVETLCEGRTSIIIAHRLSTIQKADKIVVIHHGHIVEQGTHRELLSQDGLYQRLYNLQFKGT